MRGRRLRAGYPRGFQYFNPRPHAGATIRHDHFRHHGHISIHAPMRGRRCTTGDDSKEVKNFNPRPHAGATTMAGMYRRQVRDFNPRPHAGATPDQRPGCQWTDRFGISIHAPMRGRLSDEAVRFHLTFPSFFREGQVFILSKPHFPVLFLSVCFPFALTAPWGPRGRRSFWLPGAGFCSDRCCPGCRTAGCRGLCR